MDFKNAKELLELSQNEKLTISEVMRQRELSETENSPEELYTKMERVLEIMKDSSSTPIHHPVASMGGLIGGEAKRLSLHEAAGMQLCGKVLHKAMTRAMAVLETNASMGLIVAAPTAGSAGIVPGLLLALQDVYGYSDEAMIQVLYNAGAIGYLAMRNATVAGAVGGCQAEVGVACAMAAGGLAELYGLNLDQVEYAAEIALEHHLGLTCDPICGLVQVPCIERNAVAAMRAMNACNLSYCLCGTRNISYDMVCKAMYETGLNLSHQYKETSEGGLARFYNRRRTSR